MSDELAPCPFCGGKAYSAGMDATWIGDGEWSAYCTECHVGYYECKTLGDAVAAWNRRASAWPQGDEAAMALASAIADEVSKGELADWPEIAAAVLARLNEEHKK